MVLDFADNCTHIVAVIRMIEIFFKALKKEDNHGLYM